MAACLRPFHSVIPQPDPPPPFCFSRADPHPCSLLAPLLPCPDPCCSICSVASMQLTFALSESYTHRYSCQPVCLCVCIIFLFFLIFIFPLFCIFACIIQEWVERLWRGWTALLSGLRLSACPASCLLHPFWLAGAVSLLLLIYIYTADYIYRRISMWIFSSQLEFYLALPRSLFVAIFPQIFLTIFFFCTFVLLFCQLLGCRVFDAVFAFIKWKISSLCHIKNFNIYNGDFFSARAEGGPLKYA